MSSKNVSFFLSHECDVFLKVKILSLEGKIQLLKPSQRYKNAALSKKASNVIQNSDLFVSIQVFDTDSGRNLTIPVFTKYAPFRNSRIWDQTLTLPVRINQLNVFSALRIILWEYDGESKTIFHYLEASVFNELDNTLKRGLEIFRLDQGETHSYEIINDEYAKLINEYEAGELKSSPWLDKLLISKLREGNSHRDLPIGTFVFTIEYPMTRIPVVFTDFRSSNSQDNMPTFHNSESNLQVETNMKNDTSMKLSLPKESDSNLKFYDPDQYNIDLVEEKFRRLERSSKDTDAERYIKPDASKRDLLNKIISGPPGTKLTDHEKGLVWKYRYYLSNNKKALTKLLQSTNFSEDSEVKEVLDLLEIWAEIDMDDTIELLGPRYTNISVRSYAVNRLRKASDYELELYLLQLVQSVCFECSSNLSDKSNSEFTIVDLDPMPQANGQNTLGNPNENHSEASQFLSESLDNSSIMISPLAEFLIRRAIKNSRLGNFFYWFVKSESERNTFLVHVLDSFQCRLDVDSKKILEEQVQLVGMLRSFCEQIKAAKETNVKKQELLQNLISSKMRPFFKHKNVCLPLDPDVVVTDVIPGACMVFKSSLSPLKISFQTSSGGEYSLMFKVGDDLTQDQLVVQIIKLMDQLLKNENVDLKLTPYNILATGKNEGAIEFIPNETMSVILSKHHGILGYLSENHPSSDEGSGVEGWVLDNFVKSCAGYCVITYILGVGDRHLDNLLIQPDGKFFHADFGYILGYDPKPFPPLMKLPPQIIEAFGGADSANYDKFRSYCFVAYSILRRNAGLIVNLFELMKTSDIPNIKIDPDGAVLKVMEKFAFDLSEEDATVHFQNLIKSSVNALIPLVIDHLHNLAQYWRT